MQYKIKITQVVGRDEPTCYVYQENGVEKLYYHYNHASYDCKQIIQNGDAYGEMIPLKMYYLTQSDMSLILEIVPVLETNLPEHFNDKRGRAWETFCDVSYYDMICVRVKGERDFNSQLSFHFNTTEDAILFVQLLREAS